MPDHRRARAAVIAAPERTAAIRTALEERGGPDPVRVGHRADLGAGLERRRRPAWRARAFARATALDMRPASFPERGFAPVSVARTPGMVLREDGDRFLHLFGAGYAQYNWTVFVDAAQSLGRPRRRPRGAGGRGARGGRRRCLTSSASGACGARRRSSRTATRSSSSAAAPTASRSPTTWPAITGSPTSPSSRRATSARAPPGATPRSCAPTTRPSRGRGSTTPR